MRESYSIFLLPTQNVAMKTHFTCQAFCSVLTNAAHLYFYGTLPTSQKLWFLNLSPSSNASYEKPPVDAAEERRATTAVKLIMQCLKKTLDLLLID
ncbi:hypothetical protein TNCV_855511 [Trichonephila clavipes]|nr:hypothetical protein TNCV_855511 [Trichonephila clavipes]